MLRLKNRNLQIPFGLRFTDNATGWRARPYTSFDSIVQQLMKVRQANRFLSEQNNLATSQPEVEAEVDMFNALICQSQGWNDYIDGGEAGGTAPIPFRVQTRSQKGGGQVAAGIKNAGVGIAVMIDWLGDEFMPVEIPIAQKRAETCAARRGENGKVYPCPQNGDPNWIEKMTGAVAEEMRSLLGLKPRMMLATPLDNQLHTCKACGCELKFKVWAPLKHVRAKLTEEQRAKLDPACWITNELP